jgi:hypothetical protein
MDDSLTRLVPKGKFSIFDFRFEETASGKVSYSWGCAEDELHVEEVALVRSFPGGVVSHALFAGGGLRLMKGQ